MAQDLVKEAYKYIGVVKGTAAHKAIIDGYNRRKPLPMGYQVKYWDDWCDTFVTFVSDQVGATAYIGRECGVHRHLQIFKKLGIWLGRQYPKVGDIIIFDWDQNTWADHIGIVASVSGNKITTIEGNSNNQVAKNRFVWNDRRIMGYARPNYPASSSQPSARPEEVGPNDSKIIKGCQCPEPSKGDWKDDIDTVALEVLRGKWSLGAERVRLLRQAGYDPATVQGRVNVLMKQK